MRALAKSLFSVVLLAAQFAGTPGTADAAETYPITFPVQGENHYTDTFGAPRSGGRTHAGIDIMADKMVPVVATQSGTVGWMHDEQGGNCCAMALNHDDGWSSWYIHLNNDTPGTDDGQGWGFAPGIVSGARVTKGQLIGYVGDSGNAEWTGSHLHFELHEPDGTPINPYPHLVAAQQVPEPDDVPLASVIADFTADGLDDVAVLYPGEQTWWVKASTGSAFASSPWGSAAGRPAENVHLDGDFDGDGVEDVASFSPVDGNWWVRTSTGSSFAATRWADFSTNDGWTSQIAGDFNGDGKDDIANFHPTTGRWYIARSTGGSFAIGLWADFYTNDGWTSQVVGDFNGDGKDDIANFHPRTGRWYVSVSTGTSFSTKLWSDFVTNSGWTSQIAGDFNGDGKDDIANYHPATGRWYVSRSTGTGFTTRMWADFSTNDGWTSQIAGDFNGDGKDDIANYLPSTREWWISLSTASFTTTVWD